MSAANMLLKPEECVMLLVSALLSSPSHGSSSYTMQTRGHGRLIAVIKELVEWNS